MVLTARLAWAALLLSAAPRSWAQEPPEPPGPPASGPGGSDYAHAAYTSECFGRGGDAFWLFIPAEPRPAECPVVALIHGAMELDPNTYGAWINHLARRGNAVVFPAYQSGPRTPPGDFTRNAARAIALALTRLRTAEAVKPAEGQFALAGHGEGAAIAANLAAGWSELGIPQAKAVLCVWPEHAGTQDPRREVPLWDLEAISYETVLVCLLGESASVEEKRLARRLLDEASAVPWTNKNLVTARSDDHGRPELIADRRFPTGQLGSGLQVNALDYFACWKLFDGLADSAFRGQNTEFALGDTPEQRFMGTWSDDTPVRELLVFTGAE